MRLLLYEADHSAHAVHVPNTMPTELRIPAGQEIHGGVPYFGEDFLSPARRFVLQRRMNLNEQGIFQYEEV